MPSSGPFTPARRAPAFEDEEETPSGGRFSWFNRDKGTEAPEPRARPAGAFQPPTPDRGSKARQSDKAPEEDKEKKGPLGFLRRSSKGKDEEGEPAPRAGLPAGGTTRDLGRPGLSTRGREEFPSSFSSAPERSRSVPGTGPLSPSARSDDLPRRPGGLERSSSPPGSPYTRGREEEPSRPLGGTDRFGSGGAFGVRDRGDESAPRSFGGGTFGTSGALSSRDRSDEPSRPFASPDRTSPFGSREPGSYSSDLTRPDRLGQTARPSPERTPSAAPARPLVTRPPDEPAQKPEERKSRIPLLGRSKGAKEEKPEEEKKPARSKAEAASESRFAASASSRSSQGTLAPAGTRRTGAEPPGTRRDTAATPASRAHSAPATAEPARRSRAEAAELHTPVRPLPGGQRKGAFTFHQGFDFDRRIDMIGVVLLGFALVSFFAVFPSLSFGLLPEPSGGVIGALDRLLGQWFGWGKLAWPPFAFGLGVRLMARSFEQTGFPINIARILGGVMLYGCVLAWLHMLFLIDDVAPTVEAFRPISYSLAMDQRSGGGWVGHQIYIALLSQLLDWGTFSVLIAWLIMSLLLTFDLTIAELWGFVAGVFAFIRLSPEERARRREARRLARARTVEVARPATANSPVTVTATQGAAALATATTDVEKKPAASPAEAPRPQPRIARRGAQADEEAAAPAATPAPAKEPTAPPASAPRADEQRPPERRPLPHLRSSAVTVGDAEPAEKPERVSPFAAALSPKPSAESADEPPRPADPLRRREPEVTRADRALTADEQTAGLPVRPSSLKQPAAEAAEQERLPELPLPGQRWTQTPPAAGKAPAATDSAAAVPARGGRLGKLFRRGKAAEEESARPSDGGEEKVTAEEAPARRRGLFGRREPEPKAEDTTVTAAPAQTAAESSERRSGLLGRIPFRRGAREDEDKAAPAHDARPAADTPPVVADTPAPAPGAGARRPSLFGRVTRPEDKEEEPSAADKPPVVADTPAPAPGAGARRPSLFGRVTRPERDEEVPAAPSDPDDATPARPAERPRPSVEDVAGALGAAALSVARPSAPPARPTVPDKPFIHAEAEEEALPRPQPRAPLSEAQPPSPFRPPNRGRDEQATQTDETRPADEVPAPGTERMARPAHPELLRMRRMMSGAKPGVAPPGKPAPPATETASKDEAPALDAAATQRAEPPAPGILETAPEAQATQKAAPPEEAAPRPVTPVQRVAPEAARAEVSAGGRAAPPAAARPSTPPPVIRRDPQPVAKTSADTSSPEARPAAPMRRQIAYELPDFRKLLNRGEEKRVNDEVLLEKARIIEETLASFSAPGKVVEVNPGPVITQFGVEPDYLLTRSGKKQRVKVGSIARLDADLALALAAKSIRIEAPVPGKSMVGIEVPNDEVALVSLLDIMEAPEFTRIDSKLRIALGLAVDGTPVAADLTAMPHLLIAGTTGSGKSVCVNAIIACLLLQNTPDDLQFIMVDPKRVELTGYNGIPHLVAPVVVDLERIVGVLQWVQREMETRYHKFAAIGARNILDYNKKIGPDQRRMPYYVVVIDELADLMMLAPDETERLLARLAQMARATGIHLIISTQRPSVDIITGLIKANFPARIAFMVASSVDSRVILDQPGAEKLLGRGDMLFQSPEAAAPVRMQGVFVSDEEIARITGFWKAQLIQKGGPDALAAANRELAFGSVDRGPELPGRRRSSRPAAQQTLWEDPELTGDDGMGEDELYDQAVELVRSLKKASISLLQRQLRIGYTRAARLIDRMEEDGIIGPPQEGSKPREVIKFD